MATLGDVARRAGVSAASVSRVLNHPAKVSPEVRERVTSAMAELRYVRDGAARALASRHSLTIGHVVPTLGIGIFAVGVEALQRRLEEAGYQLLVAASLYDEAKEARQVRALIERGVDGIAAPHSHVVEVAQTITDGRRATRALLAQRPEVTAICCTTDTLAIGALCECRALGVRVPEEVSVAGFSDLDIVSELDPPLSTVHIPADRIGVGIAEFLLARIAGRRGPKKIELEATMIIRGSTGPVREAARSGRRRRAM